MQLKQSTSSSTLGSVNGKKCGRSRVFRSSPKIAWANALQRPGEVGERDVLVDREPFDLVELGRVRAVVVAPVGAAWDDEVERRRVLLHRADLHRRRVGAQDHVVGQVERVRLEPRGVLRRVVERVEVVVDEVALRALDDGEAEAEEHVLDLAPGGGDQVQAADRRDRAAGERDVDDVRGEPLLELRGLELAAARLDRALERAARLVGGAADRAALLRRQVGNVAEQVRQLGLAAEVADPHLLERGAVPGPRDLRGGAVMELGDPVKHGGPFCRPRTARRSPPSRR